MCDYNYDVLVVDDVESAAKDYARVIGAQLGLKTTFTTEAQKAENIARNSDLKVVVLDQVMPIKGTELLPKLKKINPHLKFLMLTGQASNEEIGNALNLGFDGYLDKKKISELTVKVRELYADYEVTIAEQIKKQRPSYIRLLLKWPVPKKVFVLTRIVITDNFIDETKKETLLEIFSGQEKNVTREVSRAVEIETDVTNESSVCADLKISPDELGTIKTKLSSSSSIKRKIIQHISETKSVKYKLPENVEGTVDHRVIECCPVYEITKVVLGIRQLFDKEMKRSCLFIRKFTGKHHLVQTDYNHDGSITETDLGTHSIADN